jgi:hypothetical protein
MTDNTNNFKDRILNYEESVFNEYITKRSHLIENIKNLKLNDLNNDQLINMISDLKLIIDAIKTASLNIDDYFANENFNCNDSVKTVNDFMNAYFFLFVARGSDSSEVLLDSEETSELSSE